MIPAIGMKMQIVGTTLRNGLISCWEFDETAGTTAYDSTANNHDGTIVNATINQTGKLNTAYLYNGTSSQINFTSASAFQNLPAVTVSAWVKINSISSVDRYRSIVTKLHSTWAIPYYQFHLRLREGSYKIFEFDVGTSSNYAGTSTPINSATINLWHHVVGTYNGTTGVANIYLNNVSGNSGSISEGGNTGNAVSNLTIGDDDDKLSTFQNWNGLIDQTAIWNRALTTDEISLLYNSGNGLPYISW